MILVGLSTLAAIVLLALIVWALHRNQRRENEENVDRNLPLPPLQLNENEVSDISSPEEILGFTPAPSVAPRSSMANTQAEPESTPTARAVQWLSRSREHMAKGDFSNALEECQQGLPQLGAFRQSCVVLRAQIREEKKNSQAYSSTLEQLYQLAALADFFHGKAPNTKALSANALKQVDFQQFKSLSSPYAVLGFEHLGLLTKTDAKWLVEHWGEPVSHSYMRELHLAEWNNLRNSL